MLRLLTTFLAVFLTGCDPKGVLPSAATSENSLRIAGPITESSVRLLERRLDSGGLEYLIVASNGGVESFALDLADLLADHELNLVVDGLCVGVCFSILVPAARSTTVLHGSVYGFSSSTFGLSRLSPEAAQVARGNPEYASNISRSMDLYERADVPVSVLHSAVLMLNPIIETIDVSSESVRVRTFHILWAPSKSYLRRHNFHISGDLIRNERDALERAREHLDLDAVPLQRPVIYY